MRPILLLNSTNLMIRGFFDGFTLYYILLALICAVLSYAVFQKYTWPRSARHYCIWIRSQAYLDQSIVDRHIWIRSQAYLDQSVVDRHIWTVVDRHIWIRVQELGIFGLQQIGHIWTVQQLGIFGLVVIMLPPIDNMEQLTTWNN